MPIGAKLPAERDLALSYACNFLTVRKALKRLVDDGTIVRRVGSGTFIARHPHDMNSSPSREDNRIGILVYQSSNAYAYRVLQSIAHASISQNIDLRSVWVRDFGEDTSAQVAMLKKDHCVALALPWFPHEKIEEVRRFVTNCPPLPARVTGELDFPLWHGIPKTALSNRKSSVPPVQRSRSKIRAITIKLWVMTGLP